MSAIVPFARYAFPGARRAAAKALIRTGKITPRQYMAAYKIGRAAYRWRGIFKSKGYQRSKRRFVRNVRNVVRNVRSAQLKTTHLDFASDEQFTNKLNHLHHVQPYKLVYLGDGDNKRQSSTITCSGLRIQFCFANTQPNGGQPQSHLRTDYDILRFINSISTISEITCTQNLHTPRILGQKILLKPRLTISTSRIHVE
ncbi:putative capsid protein [Callinectes ornatus blue crab associated circular virus]|uniref:Putative capsid protein n=1 Tax=Callinectes ornatus blue crab associated circular virus TaxID=1692245 RepID=A0A0K1RL02_9CIRC|nr:putative capsid protein [Callinectes ornatus blue crab associated circular virus]AKV62265.1 putative capsid protein [Callinectes ornatus blue crab associated circular virus]